MEKILVLDFGGQYNQLIARRVRDQHIYAEIRPYSKITIEESGFYRLVGISKLNAEESTGEVALTFTDADGNENVVNILAHTSALINPNGSTATGYDAFGVVYLEKGTYTLNVETHCVLFTCSTLFAIPVEATDAVTE